MRALSDDNPRLHLPAYPWVIRISEEIVGDILRNFEVTPKAASSAQAS
jgi:hypothetical protein